MKVFALVIVAFLLFSETALGAADDLYKGEVPVPDQSQSAREAAFPAALEQVLAKLSGLRSLEDFPDLDAAVGGARSLVLSFYYEQREAAVTEALPDVVAEQGETPTTFLVVRFSPPGVDELMRALELPRWPANRESVQVWVLIDDGLSRRVLPVEYQYLRPPMELVARTRGLPLDWPQAGPDGAFGVDVQLLWGGYTETLSPNGEPVNVLVIAARREGPEWSTRQILQFENQHWTWRNRNIDLTEALIEAMHQVVDEIAGVHAIAAADQGSWVHEIVISGMTSGKDYERCMAYLESLPVVDEVVIRRADPGGVRLSLSLNAAPQYLEEAVAADDVLEVDELSGQYVLQP